MDRRVRPKDRAHRRQACRPSLERAERRELPSAIIPLLLGQVHPATTPAAIRAAAAGAAGGGGGASSGMGTAAAPMTLADLGTPTPHELAREQYRAAFTGPFQAGPPRFTNQAQQFLIVGQGSTSADLHANITLGLFTPADPTGTVTGVAEIFDRNVSNSGNELGLDLTGSPQDVDRAGRPTHLAWTVNGSSGGVFSGAIGEGTLDIRYLPGQHLKHSHGVHGHGQGTAQLLFKGRIFINGVTNVLQHNLNTI